jgi:FkbM family methyltransferase
MTSQPRADGRRLSVEILRRLPVMRNTLFKIFNRTLWVATGPDRTCETYFGSVMNVRLDDILGRYVYHFGVWEPHISAYVESLLRPGDYVCDVGANVGYFSLLAARRVGSAGRVVAIEASPKTFEVLEHNLALNNVENVRCVNAAVAARPGTVTLYGAPGGDPGQATIVSSRGGPKECEVEALCLESILTPTELKRTRLIKIDVEGAEGPILEHFLHTLEFFSPEVQVLVEISTDRLEKSASAPDEIIRGFAAAGFSAVSFENEYEPDAYLDFKRPSPPRPVNLPMHVQQDVLFSRSTQAATAID